MRPGLTGEEVDSCAPIPTPNIRWYVGQASRWSPITKQLQLSGGNDTWTSEKKEAEDSTEDLKKVLFKCLGPFVVCIIIFPFAPTLSAIGILLILLIQWWIDAAKS